MYSEEKDEVLHNEEEHEHHHHDEECECGHEHHHHDHDEECECGHEHHHHDHDEECECGHEHHHHDHDEECECGHEHHHHDHDEECDCGHEHHHHDHEDGCTCEACTSGISVIHHDTALAVSFKAEIDFDKDAIDKVINGAMTMLCGLVDKREGVIGHIKAAISSGEDAVMYSLTYDEVSRVGDFDKLGQVSEISYAAIVYGVEEDVLRTYMLSVKKLVEAK